MGPSPEEQFSARSGTIGISMLRGYWQVSPCLKWLCSIWLAVAELEPMVSQSCPRSGMHLSSHPMEMGLPCKRMGRNIDIHAWEEHQEYDTQHQNRVGRCFLPLQLQPLLPGDSVPALGTCRGGCLSRALCFLLACVCTCVLLRGLWT